MSSVWLATYMLLRSKLLGGGRVDMRLVAAIAIGFVGVGLVLPSLSGAAVNKLPATQYAVGSAGGEARFVRGLQQRATGHRFEHQEVRRLGLVPAGEQAVGAGLLERLQCVKMISMVMRDDDAANRDLLTRRLERKGYDVGVAASGPAALAYLAAHAADMVLLDWQMPEMSGLELVETVRDRFPHIPVILMTGVGSETIASAAGRPPSAGG